MRNLFGLSWLFATFSGCEHLARELVTRARYVAVQTPGLIFNRIDAFLRALDA